MFSFRKVWKYLWMEMRKYKLSMAFLFTAYAVGVVFDYIVKPYVYKDIVDLMSATGAHPTTVTIGSLMHLIVLLACIVVLYNIGYRAADYANSYFQSKVMKDLHDSAFRRLLNHSYSFFSNTFSGSVVAKVKRLPKGFETFFDVISWQIWFAIITLTGMIGVLFFTAPILGWIFLGWSLVYIVLTIVLIKKKIRLDVAAAAADSSVTAFLADAITNIVNVKVFTQKQGELEQFAVRTHDEETKRRKEWYFGNFQNLVQALMMGGLQIVVVIVFIHLWQEGSVQVGTFVLLQGYMLGIFDILWGLGKSLTKATQALTEMQEVVEIFEQMPDITDPEHPQALAISKGYIAFNDMSFTYQGGVKVFEHFNLHIVPGERIGLVGHSGAGKSTITKLLLRFVDVITGSIMIDSQDVRHIIQDDLRSAISYVPQESVLFHRTIRENIAYAKSNATDMEIIDAAKKAHAHEFITKLPQGYDTLVGERGVKLSGGERQRVAIARAMLKNAPILILDEATSSLDSISEQYIQEAFNELMKGKTTIVIAHRLSTIQKMDRIVVLENGAIAEEGTHKELIAKNGIYADLWNHQVGGFIE